MKGAGKKRRLPIGIQTFREIREGGFYYVDKTAFAERLAEEGKHYFLSRPRRFGKSLFLDTLKELFEGNERLFRGLHIHDRWDWSVRRPVIRLSFGSGDFSSTERLRAGTVGKIRRLAHRGGLISPGAPAPADFAELIERCSDRAGRRVVILVDEYDKPILDCLDEPGLARANRDFLRGFYGTIKDCDAAIRFSFLTGVSKFSRVSLFSGLNNLIDITLEAPFSSICGYAENDLDAVFAPELPGLDRNRIRAWYNGYNWLGDERVYNPHDLLLLFRTRNFDVHWFETATPSFLLETLRRRGLFTPALDGMFGTRDLLSSFDVGHIEPEALLFQTGYLTITGQEEDAGGRPLYRLSFPNHEVRQSLNEHLLRELAPAEASRRAPGSRLGSLLAAGDFAGVEALFRSFFASIPYEWHPRNEVARYEGYYASVFYSYCAASGLDVVAEDSSSHGRVDLTVPFRGRVYLFEFKVVEDEPEGTAIEQLRTAGYAEKYRAGDQPVTLIGIEFSRKTRNLAAFEADAA